MSYNTLLRAELIALILNAPGGPAATNNTQRLAILRAMSEEDQAAAFLENGIVRPGHVAGGIGDGDDVGDDVKGRVAAMQAQLDIALETILTLRGLENGGTRDLADLPLPPHLRPDFVNASGDERLNMFGSWKASEKPAFISATSMKGRRNNKSAVTAAVLGQLLEYKLGKVELQDFTGGIAITGALGLQNGYKNLQFNLNELFKDKVAGMSDLLERFNMLWGESEFSVGMMLDFEARIRKRISRSVLDFSFESVEKYYLSEWNEVRWTRHLPAPDNPISPPPKRLKNGTGIQGKSICFKWNDGYQCYPGCNRKHVCIFCADN
jgi:hypothetical protein